MVHAHGHVMVSVRKVNAFPEVFVCNNELREVRGSADRQAGLRRLRKSFK